MKFRPLRDRLLVRRIEADPRTKGGIIIPDSAREKPQEGKVIASGKGRITGDGKLQHMEVQVGDRVLFARYAGTEIRLDGEDLVILREDDVMAVAE